MKNYLFIVLPLVAALIMTSGCGASKQVTTIEPVEIAPEVVEEVATEVIGSQMDKQIADLETIEGVQVEAVSGDNNLKVIKVTIAEGILFATGSSELGQASRNALTNFARSLVNHPQTNVTIHGHTDNTGTRAINDRLSGERAKSVSGFLSGQGVSTNRMTTQGFASDSPVADNSTSEGRTKNRRVEIFISADEEMIQQARAEAVTRVTEQANTAQANPAPATSTPATSAPATSEPATSAATTSTKTSSASSAEPRPKREASYGESNFNKGNNIVALGAGIGGSLY